MTSIQVGSGRGLEFRDLPGSPDNKTVAKLSFWLGSIGGQLMANNPDDPKYKKVAQAIIDCNQVIDQTFGGNRGSYIPTHLQANFVVATLETLRVNALEKDKEAERLYKAAALEVRDWFIKVAERHGQRS